MLRREGPRLVTAWASVLVFLTAGHDWLDDLGSPAGTVALFAWLLGVILWCAFGVVAQAERIAAKLGEPFGTLILTLSIVVIEVMLISASMLGDDAGPTVGRDTMFAVMMIVLNGVVGLALVIGGVRHREQSYNLPGAAAYLAVIIPLTTIALILPALTTSGGDGTLTTAQAIPFAAFTVVLYGIFLAIQTGRHRSFFAAADAEPAAGGAVRGHAVLLIALVLPIVLLAESLAKIVEHGITELDAPAALTGFLIAIIVFAPEAAAALRAAARNELQRTINLCLGAFVSTVGLTLPAILLIGVVTGQPVVLGLEPAGIALAGLTLLMSMLTFSGPRTTVLEGAVHLLVFCTFVVLIFSP